ncbi:MAG TPA: LysE family transporter [Anaerovoracaceae bacterium]|nr:LysE family transporter [Anaerovoracaceae bacterium]
MLESIITISITGLLAGFIFAMPIAGPISILITSNALKGKLRYCNLVSLGASFADFTFVFIAVFGLTRLYSLYTPAIPYMYAAGTIFFLFLGHKIFRTKIDAEHLDNKRNVVEKAEKKERGAFYTGLMINFLNPTLFIGALTSSFFVISLIASMGFHTGGLATKIDQNLTEINRIEGRPLENTQQLPLEQYNYTQILKSKSHDEEQTQFPVHFHLLISICYAFFLSVGSILWFFLLAFLIVRFRQRFNIKVIAGIIKSLGVVLSFIGLYFGYLSVKMFFVRGIL